MWWSTVSYSRWLGGPSISSACGKLAMGLEGGGGCLECGVGSAEGWEPGSDGV